MGPDAVQENQEDGATDEQKAHHITTPSSLKIFMM